MGWFRKNADDRPRLSPADGDEELEQLLTGDVDLAAYVDLVQSRAHVEKRAVAVHALALSHSCRKPCPVRAPRRTRRCGCWLLSTCTTWPGPRVVAASSPSRASARRETSSA